MRQAPEPMHENPPVERSGTAIETDDDIRKAISSSRTGEHAGPPITVEPKVPVAPLDQRPREPRSRSVPADRTSTGRPRNGVRRRQDQRRGHPHPRSPVHHRSHPGDLRIPIDGRISAGHVETTHQVVRGLHRGAVTDLQSTHGLFVRISKTPLADKAEILIGNGRYRLTPCRLVLRFPAGGDHDRVDRRTSLRTKARILRSGVCSRVRWGRCRHSGSSARKHGVILQETLDEIREKAALAKLGRAQRFHGRKRIPTDETRRDRLGRPGFAAPGHPTGSSGILWALLRSFIAAGRQIQAQRCRCVGWLQGTVEPHRHAPASRSPWPS